MNLVIEGRRGHVNSHGSERYISTLVASSIAFVTLSLGACSGSEPGIVPESPHWLLNGLPAPSSTSLSVLTDSILPEIAGHEYEYYRRGKTGSWRIDTVGEWHDKTVMDLFFEMSLPQWEDSTKKYTHIAAKGIALETSADNYRLLYARWSEPGNVYYKPSSITQIGSDRVLSTSSPMSGTGAFIDDAYWTWDEEVEIPLRLYIHRALGKAIDKVVPVGHGIWKGGGFNMDSLSYITRTWRRGDGNCCPSGGTIRADFDIRGGRLIVREAIFDFTDRDPRAIAEDRRTGDSGYMESPPIIFEGESNASPERNVEWLNTQDAGRMYYPGRSATTLDTLMSVDIKRWTMGAIYQNIDSIVFEWRLDTVGTVADYSVVEIAYSFHCPPCRDTVGKVIAVEVQPALYRPIYHETTLPGESSIGKNAITKLGGEDIIAVMGSYWYGKPLRPNYWVWSHKRDIPVPLYQDWVLKEVLNRHIQDFLPDGLTVRPDLGEWSFLSMTYETPVWATSDTDGEPSGGDLLLQFGVRDDRLVVEEVTYRESAK